MKIPPQCSPEHHRYLTRGACGRFEIRVAGVRYGGNKQVVVMKCGNSVSMDMVYFGRLVLFFDGRKHLVRRVLVILFVIFGV